MQSKKVLFTTTYAEPGRYFDYSSYMEPEGRIFDFSLPRKKAYGLRFIKRNIPSIQILEYPTWEQYLSELNKGWDIVGFSFFQNEIAEILKMAGAARRVGMEELWIGNYGALTEEIQDKFDRAFIGYSEREIAKEFGFKLNEVKHPPITWDLYISPRVKVNRFGILFTTRGCPYGCNFCQTPVFHKGLDKIPLGSIEEVLQIYEKMRVFDLEIADESFGLLKDHTEDVVSILGESNFRWVAQMRMEDIPDDISDWMSKGFLGVIVGVESLRQEALDGIGKKRTLEFTLDKIRMLRKHNRFILAGYMLGYEDDTVESIRRDIKELAKFKLDMVQLCIITPFPQTVLRKEIEEKYGIFDHDYHHYDASHLVWNHPNIAPDEMHELLNWARGVVRPRSMMPRMSIRMIRRYVQLMGFVGGMRYVGRHYIDANLNYGDHHTRLE